MPSTLFCQSVITNEKNIQKSMGFGGDNTCDKSSLSDSTLFPPGRKSQVKKTWIIGGSFSVSVCCYVSK